MAFSRTTTAFPGSNQPCPFSLTSSPTIVSSNFRNMPRKARAAPKQSSLVASPPNGTHKFTERFESLHETRLEEVRNLLVGMVVEKNKCSSLESLVMVDALQRLGIDYCFQDETRSILQEHHHHHHQMMMMPTGHDCLNHRTSSLYEVALRFRLLRQEGYFVPADVFESFKSKDYSNNGESTFHPYLQTDIVGLTSLYEASHLGMQGEDILDQAASFSKRALTSWENHFLYMDDYHIHKTSSSGSDSEAHMRELVKNTLSNPFHMSLPRFTAKSFRSNFFREGHEWIEPFKELSLLDSNLLASANRNEIAHISKWWRDLGLAKEVKLARDQPVKWYTWPMVMMTDPKLSQERIDLTKSIAMVYIIDDIFDVYKSIDDLTLFTQSIQRWECSERLPDYMKACFRALDGIINEISTNIYKKRGWNPTLLMRKSWLRLCEAFLVEARWFTSPNHPPSTVEYLDNAIVTAGSPVIMAHSFALLYDGCINDQILIEMLDGCSDVPEIPLLTAKILRLWDDLGSAKDENQQGHDGSYAYYYIRENPSCSQRDANEQVKKMISEAWKSLNRKCLFNYKNSPAIIRAFLNAARIIPLMYNYDENQRLTRIEGHLKSLLVE